MPSATCRFACISSAWRVVLSAANTSKIALWVVGVKRVRAIGLFSGDGRQCQDVVSADEADNARVDRNLLLKTRLSAVFDGVSTIRVRLFDLVFFLPTSPSSSAIIRSRTYS